MRHLFSDLLGDEQQGSLKEFTAGSLNAITCSRPSLRRSSKPLFSSSAASCSLEAAACVRSAASSTAACVRSAASRARATNDSALTLWPGPPSVLWLLARSRCAACACSTFAAALALAAAAFCLKLSNPFSYT